MANNTKKHVVKSGEVLGKIARDNGVTVEQIQAINPALTNPDKIFAGQVILIPVPGGVAPGEPNDINPAPAPPQPPAPSQPPTPGVVIRGMDANLSLDDQDIVACLQGKGFRFAVRYYTRKDRSRTLTLSEAQRLVRAGFQLGAVFEDGFPKNPQDQPGFFTHAQGVGDAQAAHDRASNRIGQPAGSTIYFGVDFDANREQIDGGITRYFEAVNETFRAANNGNLKYAIGVYGSGLTCTKLLDKKLVTFAWLSQSTGHSGTKNSKRKSCITWRRDQCRKTSADLMKSMAMKRIPIR